jgi:hypothetical protein
MAMPFWGRRNIPLWAAWLLTEEFQRRATHQVDRGIRTEMSDHAVDAVSCPIRARYGESTSPMAVTDRDLSGWRRRREQADGIQDQSESRIDLSMGDGEC